jgi:ATP-dependent protease ClpP protease subunit
MASDAAEAVIDVVGVIGWEVAYQQMRDMLRSIPESVKRVTFDIYSPGGDVWEGNGIVQEIGELGKRAETVARIQVAASMATLIAVACQKRVMAANGRFLIHNAWTATVGDAATHEKTAATLRACEQEAAKFYAARTGGQPEEMLALMAQERWLEPEECKAMGFATDICDPFKVEDFAAVKQEIVAAGRWPKALVEMPKQEVKKDATQSNNGAVATAPVEPIAAVKSPDVAPVQQDTEQIQAELLAAEYQRGLVDGLAKGKAASLIEIESEVTALKAALETAQAESRKNQSEKDKLTAALKAAQIASDERAKVLRAELDEATAKLRKFVSGALTFSATVETWPEAVADCGGSYEKARAKYPQVFERYLADERRKGTK